MRDEDKARVWAFNGEHLKVYPQPITKLYNTKNSIGKTVSLPYVNLVLEIGNAKHLGKEVYKQNSEALKAKTDELYLHYYYKRTKD